MNRLMMSTFLVFATTIYFTMNYYVLAKFSSMFKLNRTISWIVLLTLVLLFPLGTLLVRTVHSWLTKIIYTLSVTGNRYLGPPMRLGSQNEITVFHLS